MGLRDAERNPRDVADATARAARDVSRVAAEIEADLSDDDESGESGGNDNVVIVLSDDDAPKDATNNGGAVKTTSGEDASASARDGDETETDDEVRAFRLGRLEALPSTRLDDVGNAAGADTGRGRRSKRLARK